MITMENDTRGRIRSKASEMFMKWGVRSVSMDDIANGLGASKKTLYQYFSDKDELVDAVVEQIVAENQYACDIDRMEAANAVEEIFKAMDMVEVMFRNMNASILYDLQKYHPKAFNRFLKHKNDYLYSVVRSNLERGIAEELYRNDINVELLSRFRVESMMLFFNPDFMGRQKIDFAEVQQIMMEHFLFGVASLKGHKLILKYQQEREKKPSKHETGSKVK
jgi:TetR/AcrR family transcriptional regulator, cholesterol catabolism regulator